MCGPASDADCAQSEACRTEGHCTVREVGGMFGTRGPTCDPGSSDPFGIGASGLMGTIGAQDSEVGWGGMGTIGQGAWGEGEASGLGGLGTVATSSEPVPRVDPVRVLGGRSPKEVRQALRAVRAKVKACTTAEVAVAFDIDGKGKLSAVEVRSGAEGKQAGCVVKAVQKAQLGAGPAGSATWTVRQG
jgi:hypothetical protein